MHYGKTDIDVTIPKWFENRIFKFDAGFVVRRYKWEHDHYRDIGTQQTSKQKYVVERNGVVLGNITRKVSNHVGEATLQDDDFIVFNSKPAILEAAPIVKTYAQMAFDISLQEDLIEKKKKLEEEEKRKADLELYKLAVLEQIKDFI